MYATLCNPDIQGAPELARPACLDMNDSGISMGSHAVRPRRYSAVLWGMAKGTSISPVSMVR